jgi:hypothetical protein
MLLASVGIDSNEDDQIRRMAAFMPDGGLNGAGAHFGYASQALGGRYGNRMVDVWFRDRNMNNDPQMNAELVSMLQKGRPVMVATPQHGMVAVAVQFIRHRNGYCEIRGVEVLDPVSGRRWLPLMELAAVFGFMAIAQ